MMKSLLVLYYGRFIVEQIIAILGVILNTINLLVFIRGKFRQPAYLLMTALSLTDLVTCLFRVPTCYLYSGRQSKVITKYSLYFESPLNLVTESLNAWLTVLMAIERYVAMRHWHLSRRHFSRQKVKAYVLGICIIGVICNIPGFYANHAQMHDDIYFHSKFYQCYSWFRFLISNIIPLVLLCLFNCLLIRVVQVHANQFQPKSSTAVVQANRDYKNNKNSHSNHSLLENSESTTMNQLENSVKVQSNINRQRAQTKLTILLITVIMIFLVAHTPQALAYRRVFAVLNICATYYTCTSYVVFYAVSTNLALLAFSSNFFVYVFLNSHYRKVFLDTFSCFSKFSSWKKDRTAAANNTVVENINKNKQQSMANGLKCRKVRTCNFICWKSDFYVSDFCQSCCRNGISNWSQSLRNSFGIRLSSCEDITDTCTLNTEHVAQAETGC